MLYRKDELKRINGEPGTESAEAYRSAFRKDYGRLIHAPAFRRLQSKTQLYPGAESDFFRNRLTHSLEVAQIATSIALKLNDEEMSSTEKIDVDLVAFAGLAHDLGHPPFGHNGEKALDDLMLDYGGFEGNAQSLRILSRLEKKQKGNQPLGDHLGRFGLNPTFRTLASVLKYDQLIPARRAKKGLVKGYYASEKELVEEVKARVAPGLSKTSKFKTIECQIMDVADDIAYSTYDLEDSLKGCFLSPLEILQEVVSNQRVRSVVAEKVRKALKESPDPEAKPSFTEEEVKTFAYHIFDQVFDKMSNTESSKDLEAGLGAFKGSSELCTDGYVRTWFTSDLVGTFMSGIQFKKNRKFPALSEVWLSTPILKMVEVLKHLNYQLVILSPRLSLVNFRGGDVVKGIFEALTRRDGQLLLPPDVQRLCEEQHTDHRYRTICDFIAGMTDRYAIEFYGRLYSDDQKIFKPI